MCLYAEVLFVMQITHTGMYVNTCLYITSFSVFLFLSVCLHLVHTAHVLRPQLRTVFIFTTQTNLFQWIKFMVISSTPQITKKNRSLDHGMLAKPNPWMYREIDKRNIAEAEEEHQFCVMNHLFNSTWKRKWKHWKNQMSTAMEVFVDFVQLRLP